MGSIVGVVCVIFFLFVVLSKDPFLPSLPTAIFVSPLVIAMFAIYHFSDSIVITYYSTIVLTIIYVIVTTTLLDDKGKRR